MDAMPLTDEGQRYLLAHKRGAVGGDGDAVVEVRNAPVADLGGGWGDNCEKKREKDQQPLLRISSAKLLSTTEGTGGTEKGLPCELRVPCGCRF